MRCRSRLGAVNAALISIYFASVWGSDAVRVLTSPFYGFEDRLQATAAGYFRGLLDLGLEGLVRASNLLAGIKLVIAAGFLAYLIDFIRALMAAREPNRETLDVVLLLAGGAIMLWAWPALHAGDAGLVRLLATQFLLLIGAMIVIAVERQLEEAPAAAARALAGGRAADAAA